MERSISPRTRLIVITNLHNPTGVRTPDSTLKLVGDIARSLGAISVDDWRLFRLAGPALIAETVPGIEFSSWLGLAMPPATPRQIVDRINREIRAALALPDVEKRLAEGGNVASPLTPEEMRRKIAGDIARWSRVIETAGIKTE